MQQRISLQDIRREASALEFDVATQDGYLSIVKRSHPTLCYLSTQTADDPRTLSEAWTWLQRCRTSIDQHDLARVSIASRQRPVRQGRTFNTALRFGAHFLPGLMGGGIAYTFTGNLYISGGVSALSVAATSWLAHRRSTRKRTMQRG